MQIALELISRVKKLVCIKMLIADGLYATKEKFSTLIKEKFYFEMSFHANRVNEYNGKKIGIKQIKDLELKGKKFARTKLTVNFVPKMFKKIIFLMFFAYALLQFETKKFGLKNPESAAK